MIPTRSTARSQPPARPTEAQRPPGPRRRWSARRLAPGVVLLAGALALGLAVASGTIDQQAIEGLRGRIAASWAGPQPPEPGPRPDAVPRRPARWDGLVRLDERQQAALGLATVAVRPQTEPISLELLGATDYDPTTMSRVRPMFRCRVDTVHVSLGDEVRRGDPLIDLFSTELADAKSRYEIEHIEWVYYNNLLQTRRELFATRSVSEQQLRETENEEMKQRREYEVARDTLLVLGLTSEEVEAVRDEEGSDKARMTLRAPADGIVIERDVAPGNLYDENDTLLTIAPLNHLWVWGNVFEMDLELVRLGQAWDIHFSFLGRTIRGAVDFIDNRVDPQSRTMRIRTTIENREGLLKSNMLVQGRLQIPPEPGRTVIPRTALVVADGRKNVFVPVPDEPGTFARRDVEVVLEKEDHVVLGSGVEPGEQVVSVGSLILDQIYRDHLIIDHGAVEGSPEPTY